MFTSLQGWGAQWRSFASHLNVDLNVDLDVSGQGRKWFEQWLSKAVINVDVVLFSL